MPSQSTRLACFLFLGACAAPTSPSGSPGGDPAEDPELDGVLFDADPSDGAGLATIPSSCPAVFIDQAELSFHALQGEEGRATLTLRNLCEDGDPLEVQELRFEDDSEVFSLVDPQLVEGLELLPGEGTGLEIRFTPGVDLLDLGALGILTNDPRIPEIAVDLTGMVGEENDSRSGGAPHAAAGPDQVVVVGDTVALDGTGSTDPEGDTLSYVWSFAILPSGSALTNASISGSKTSSATFVPDVSGAYLVRFVVSDGSSTGKDFAWVTATDGANDPPNADAGTELFGAVGSLVTLDGSASSDPDGDALSYSWSFAGVPSGSAITTASITNPTSVTASYTPDVAGDYRVRLLVSDGAEKDKAFAWVRISGSNSAPVADAGADQRGDIGDSFTLDGSGSSDPDGDALSYTWTFKSVPSGSALTSSSISGASTATPSFTSDLPGIYELRLKVSDGSLSSKDVVKVVVNEVLPLTDADVLWWGGAADQQLTTAAVTDDLDGDGTRDLWVAGIGSFTSAGPYSTIGLLTDPLAGGTLADATVSWTGTSSELGGGWVMDSGADLDGDGYRELLVGAPNGNYSGTSTTGTAFLFYGPATTGGDMATGADYLWYGVGTYSKVGYSLDMGSDLTGDGVADVVIGNPAYYSKSKLGRTYIMAGPPPKSGSIEAWATWTITGTASSSGNFGAWVESGDLNGDGLADLVASDPSAGGIYQCGVLYVFYGPITADLLASDADASRRGIGISDGYGKSPIADQDFDGDGMDDLVAGAWFYSGTASHQGAVYLETGPISSSKEARTTATAAWLGSTSNDYLGSMMAGLDYNGDGNQDLAFTAFGSGAGEDGGAYLAYGPHTGTTMAEDVGLVLSSDAWSNVRAIGADLDQDGFDELIIGNAKESDSASEEGLIGIMRGMAY